MLPGCRECYAKGCTRVVPLHMLMCARHWNLVHEDLKRAVWATWNRYRRERTGANARAHAEAAKRARTWVAELEAAAVAAKRAISPQAELF